MDENVKSFSRILELARQGRPGSHDALRKFLKNCADEMPEHVLVAVSETLLNCRREEINDDIRRN